MSLPQIPDELDVQFYRTSNPDLATLSDRELSIHYLQFGRKEGRPSAAMALREFFVPIAGQHSSILEIGPFYRPSLIGSNVSYFDVLDVEALRERALQHGLPLDNIPANITYVSPTGDLSIVTDTFQALFSSHVIEHQPCIVSHLMQASKVLVKGGFYFLIIPDKRYCFDHFIAESSIADVICAFHNKSTTHTLCSVIEHIALTTHNDAPRHWAGDHADPGFEESLVNRVNSALDQYTEAHGSYIDVHAWQFTPANFKSITASLHALGFLDLYPLVVYDTPHGRQEFTAVLTKL